MPRDGPQSDSVSSLTADPPARHLSTYVLVVCAQKMASAHPDGFPMGQAWRAVLRKSELAAVCSASASAASNTAPAVQVGFSSGQSTCSANW